MNALIETIVSADPRKRDRAAEDLLGGKPTRELLRLTGELEEFRRAAAPPTLGYVGRYRCRRPAHLTGQAEEFLPGIVAGEVVNLLRQLHPLLPDFQVLIRSYGHSFLPSAAVCFLLPLAIHHSPLAAPNLAAPRSGDRGHRLRLQDGRKDDPPLFESYLLYIDKS